MADEIKKMIVLVVVLALVSTAVALWYYFFVTIPAARFLLPPSADCNYSCLFECLQAHGGPAVGYMFCKNLCGIC